jgi:uncharacterized protein YceK
MEDMEVMEIMRLWVPLVVFVLLSGCASRDVRCDGRLTAINVSAPAAYVHEPRASHTP